MPMETTWPRIEEFPRDTVGPPFVRFARDRRPFRKSLAAGNGRGIEWAMTTRKTSMPGNRHAATECAFLSTNSTTWHR
jgi:hypothetical protein